MLVVVRDLLLSDFLMKESVKNLKALITLIQQFNSDGNNFLSSPSNKEISMPFPTLIKVLIF